MANLEQSRRRILDAESVKLMFSLIVTFYPTKTEHRTKKSLTQLLHYCTDFLQNNADISIIKRVLVLKVLFYETTYVFVLTCQI